MRWSYAIIALSLMACSTAIYANFADLIAQSNSNADRIAAQAQVNMQQDQQILAQRLQALAAAMEAQNPDTPIVVQAVPAQVQPVRITPPPVTKATPAAPPATMMPNATGLTPPSQNNSNNSNQWNYGF